MPLRLGVNIDHVATLRQARYAHGSGGSRSALAEPDLVLAAQACERAGAHGITMHLRADRRHVQDQDIFDVKALVNLPLNLELGNTPEIVGIAERLGPAEVCLVPENRREITTEGGLDVAGQVADLTATVERLQAAGARVSMFIDPEEAQVRASLEAGADMVELHTGAFANAVGEARGAEIRRLVAASHAASSLGLQVNAGHGINYSNLAEIFLIPQLHDLNIGHSIVSRSVFAGLESAVREMLLLMAEYPCRGRTPKSESP